jgi:4-amino-4-deoxy-L-arabinose transferase-like glycosyltransferase
MGGAVSRPSDRVLARDRWQLAKRRSSGKSGYFNSSLSVTVHPDIPPTSVVRFGEGATSISRLSRLIWPIVLLLLFYQLGAPALFEPDEGRNAEKAREVLVLDDWVTPHENFHPVLDKPIFFYWLIATAYALFGMSEWSARLPSALAAFGCVALVYRFSRVQHGPWAALWSALILLTSVEFFVLARIVIFDMTLTFFITLALYSFYQAAHSESASWRRAWCVALYGALATATLIKGLIGLAVPAMVIGSYLLATRRWSILWRIYPAAGAALYLAIVTPWYAAAEARNPGYLHYYLWQEHFGRFATAEFDRAQPWYYFIAIGLAGFFPWTLLLPALVKDTWRSKLDDATLFWLLWVAVPLLFFSLSRSKLPHYILPLFPPLAMLAASALVRLYQESPGKLRFALSLTWWLQAAAAIYLTAGSIFPTILARHIRTAVSIELTHWVWIYAAVAVTMLVYTTRRQRAGQAPSQRQIYVGQGLSCGFLLLFIVQMMIAISADRSAKTMAQAALPRLTPATQIVFYDTYLAGLPFYLRSERPLWLITHDQKKRTFLGNYYAVRQIAEPVSAWGTVILNFEEFRRRWDADQQSLLVIVKEKNFARLTDNVGELPVRLAGADEYLWVSKRAGQSHEIDKLSKRTE